MIVSFAFTSTTHFFQHVVNKRYICLIFEVHLKFTHLTHTDILHFINIFPHFILNISISFLSPPCKGMPGLHVSQVNSRAIIQYFHSFVITQSNLISITVNFINIESATICHNCEIQSLFFGNGS